MKNNNRRGQSDEIPTISRVFERLMELGDDFGSRSGIDFEIDDEASWMDRGAGHTNDDSDGDSDDDDDDEDDGYDDDSHRRKSLSENISNCYVDHQGSWPRSYRQSMDMLSGITPPTTSFLRGNSGGPDSPFSQLFKRPSTYEHDPSLSKPFIEPPNLSDPERGGASSQSQKLSIASSTILLTSDADSSTSLCSFGQATLNTINVMCGMGLLSTPYTIQQGGWSSLLLLVIFGIIACYTGILLKQCLESSEGLKTYPDIGEAAFGKAGRLGIAIMLYMDLYATCVEYIIMMSDNLSSLFPNTHTHFAGFDLEAEQVFAILMTLVILPTVWLRDLSLLSYISAGGVISSVLLVLCLLWVGSVGQVGFHPGGVFLNFAKLPITVGLAGFCYSAHSVFPNIYLSMKKPSQYPFVMISTFAICFVLYFVAAIVGYLMFGDSVQSQFTLNMPKEFMVSKIAVWTTVLNPVARYAITITPVALCLEELLPSAEFKGHIISIIIRTLLVISTLVVALTIPFFGIVMALIGSFLAMLLAFILPSLCTLILLGDKLSKLQMAVCTLIIITGLVCGVIGTYSAIAGVADEVA